VKTAEIAVGGATLKIGTVTLRVGDVLEIIHDERLAFVSIKDIDPKQNQVEVEYNCSYVEMIEAPKFTERYRRRIPICEIVEVLNSTRSLFR
jgi:hypothetical protein